MSRDGSDFFIQNYILFLLSCSHGAAVEDFSRFSKHSKISRIKFHYYIDILIYYNHNVIMWTVDCGVWIIKHNIFTKFW